MGIPSSRSSLCWRVERPAGSRRMEAGLYNHADAEAEESKYADPADGSLELLASPSNRDTTDIMQIAFCCESNLTSMTAVATSNQTCPACGHHLQGRFLVLPEVWDEETEEGGTSC